MSTVLWSFSMSLQCPYNFPGDPASELQFNSNLLSFKRSCRFLAWLELECFNIILILTGCPNCLREAWVLMVNKCNNYSNSERVGETLVRFWSLSNPFGKVTKIRVWELLFEWVCHFTMIENLYLIVEVVESFFHELFAFILSLIYLYFWISLSCGWCLSKKPDCSRGKTNCNELHS